MSRADEFSGFVEVGADALEGFEEVCIQPRAIGDRSDEELAELREKNHVGMAEQLHVERLVREGKLPTDALPEGARPIVSRARIDAGEQRLPIISGLCWEAIEESNHPEMLFRYADAPHRIARTEDGRLKPELLDAERLRYELARRADFYRTVHGRHGPEAIDAKPPLDVVRDMLAAPDPPLPSLDRIVSAPVFTRDGTLCERAGYNRNGKIFLDWQGPPLDIPKSPTVKDAKAAAAWLTEEIFRDFPFPADSDRAAAFAFLLSPFVRDLIPGPTPIFGFEAGTPGSGKNLLSEVCAIPSGLEKRVLLTEGRDEDEMRKRATSALLGGAAIIQLDNLAHGLESPTLAAIITSDVWSDRLLGSSRTVSILVRAIFAFTANNPVLSGEIARRTIRSRLDPKIDRPWLRDGFKHPDLKEWCIAHRAEIIEKCLVVVSAWLAADRPAWNGPVLGSFESWSRILGGILGFARINGFLDGLDMFYESSDADGATWSNFAAAWWEAFGPAPQTVKALFPLALDIDGFDLGTGSERSQRSTLGRALARMRDRVFGGFRIVSAGIVHHAAAWKLEQSGNMGTSGNIPAPSKIDTPLFCNGPDIPQVPQVPLLQNLKTEPEYSGNIGELFEHGSSTSPAPSTPKPNEPSQKREGNLPENGKVTEPAPAPSTLVSDADLKAAFAAADAEGKFRGLNSDTHRVFMAIIEPEHVMSDSERQSVSDLLEFVSEEATGEATKGVNR